MRADRMTHYIGRLHPIIAEVPAVFSSTFPKRILTSLGDLFIDLSRSGKRIGLPITEVTCAKRIEPHPPHATPRHVTRPFTRHKWQAASHKAGLGLGLGVGVVLGL